jgi:hypothetical protein
VVANNDALKETAKAERPITAKYRVLSDLPLVLHAGVAVNRLSDIDVEKVRSQNGTDLFREIQNPSEQVDLTTMLSYELATSSDGSAGILMTLGTNVKNPGRVLLAGVSLKFLDRVFLSFGFSTKAANEGENLLTEDLFKTFRAKRHWGGFLALSASPF